MKYTERTLPPETAQRVIESLAEGVVEANRAIIDADPDSFPCCCGCGEFTLVPQRAVPLSSSVRNLQVQGPQMLSKTKTGNALELACFQCAQRRREGDEEAHVEIEVDEDGYIQALVVRQQGEDEDMVKYLPARYEPSRNCAGGVCGTDE